MAWNWIVRMIMDKADELREYKRKWEAEHKEKRREQNIEAVKRYEERKMAEDPEGFLEYRREIKRRSAKKRYHETKDTRTEEEIERRRAQKREWARKNREKKRAEKASKEKENQNDN